MNGNGNLRTKVSRSHSELRAFLSLTFCSPNPTYDIWMAVLLALRPVGSVSLGLFVLLEHLAMLLASALAVDCKLRGFLGRAVGVVGFARPFLSFVDDAVVLCLDSGLGLGLSCAGTFGALVLWWLDVWVGEDCWL